MNGLLQEDELADRPDDSFTPESAFPEGSCSILSSLLIDYREQRDIAFTSSSFR
jgi:hypothetical protein